MRVVDPGDPTATDIIDGGDTASPPTDVVDSVFVLPPQTTTGILTPVYEAVDSAQGIAPEPGLVLYVKVGGTSTQVTMQVPGNQPYTGVAKDDLVLAGLSNTERAFFIAPLLVESSDDVGVVAYSQTVGVSSALLKVG